MQIPFNKYMYFLCFCEKCLKRCTMLLSVSFFTSTFLIFLLHFIFHLCAFCSQILYHIYFVSYDTHPISFPFEIWRHRPMRKLISSDPPCRFSSFDYILFPISKCLTIYERGNHLFLVCFLCTCLNTTSFMALAIQKRLKTYK